MKRKIDQITKLVGQNFMSFGGGKGGNPLAEALKDGPLVFAAGVPVAEVVKFVAIQLVALDDDCCCPPPL